MGFTRFKFSKLWTSAADFPTVETDEVRVREDMQLLHDEAKNGLNSLMDSLEAQSAAGNLGALAPDGKTASNVQKELQGLNTAKHAHSNKTVLDQITAAFTTSLKTTYDALVSKLSGIKAVVTTLGSDDTTIPTSKAVRDALLQAGNIPTDDLISKADKPIGSYTGNGSATKREIDTGVVSNRNSTVMIREDGGNSFAIVNASGFLGKSGSSSGGGAITCGSSAVFSGVSGKIVITTDNALFNTNGTTYNWYCL